MDRSPPAPECVLSSKLGKPGCWEGIASGAELVALLAQAENIHNVRQKFPEQCPVLILGRFCHCLVLVFNQEASAGVAAGSMWVFSWTLGLGGVRTEITVKGL